MDVTQELAGAEPSREPRVARLAPGARELAAILAFWTAWALLSLANRFFDPDSGPPGSFAAYATVAAIESLCWSVLTVLFFALAGRIDLEGSYASRRRWVGALGLLLAGIAAAALMGWIGRDLRTTITPMRVRIRPHAPFGAPSFVGPRLWFGFLINLVISLGVVATSVARAYSLRLRARSVQAVQLTSQLAEARLDALRRQLDPHFLFNTLNAISSLVERDPRGVRRMIARLGDLLRHSFEGGDAPEVPLHRELALLALYVDIVRVRFQDRLTVDIRVDDAVLDALVPTFILQPVVENAVKHGIERRTEGGAVVVEGTRDGNSLVLCVRNDAPSDPDLLATAASGLGVGVRNTRAGLQQLYGAAQRFTLERDGEQVVAEIRLPYHVRGVADAAEAAARAVTGEHRAELAAGATRAG
jgi:hypothetical protein